ncbi:MAG: cysteine hydrolase [Deltaproteobacteria bacterium]|nr:cysteine hydrolase [Deltaproteobacteria bacterium]
MTTCFIVLGLLGAASVAAQTIVDEWSTAKAPPAPELKPVAITNLKETALFILDIQKQTCNPERRPRCIASVPKIRKLLAEARAKGMPVLHATSTGKIADILPEVPPREGEPVVHSGPNKFTGTDLEKILKDRGIKTLVMVGTAAHGAVVYTASEAAFRGFKVVVPVDGMSAESIYIEQYVTYQLVNGPRLGPAVTLTKFDLLKF